MDTETKIRWSHRPGYVGRTWNPMSGCTKVSPGCKHCYAMRIAEKFSGGPSFPVGFTPVLKPNKLDDPAKWKEPSMIFVNSMSDVFHDAFPDDYIDRVFEVMMQHPRHLYQVLTKRPERMASYVIGWLTRNGFDKVPAHIWLGVSVENQEWADRRLPVLVGIEAHVLFVSAEPLLGPIDFAPWLDSLHWIIVGGESGPDYRPMDHAWAGAIRDQCIEKGVAFYFKQSAAPRTEMGQLLDGERWEQYPA